MEGPSSLPSSGGMMDSMYVLRSTNLSGQIMVGFSKDEVAGILECLDGYGPGEGVLGDLKDELEKWDA